MNAFVSLTVKVCDRVELDKKAKRVGHFAYMFIIAVFSI